jgi:hypothetical protein
MDPDLRAVEHLDAEDAASTAAPTTSVNVDQPIPISSFARFSACSFRSAS